MEMLASQTEQQGNEGHAVGNQVINRKITAMHREFGENGAHKCKDCPNLRTFKAGKRRDYKCAAYGISCSQATDWAKRWTACGMYGKQIPADHVPLMKRLKPAKRQEKPLDGQIGFLEESE